MAPKIPVPRTPPLVDLAKQCRNWRTTAGGTERRMSNQASALMAIGTAINYALAQRPRILASAGQQIYWDGTGGTPPSNITHHAQTSASSPNYVSHFRDGVDNADKRTGRMLLLPTTNDSGNGRAELSVAMDGGMNITMDVPRVVDEPDLLWDMYSSVAHYYRSKETSSPHAAPNIEKFDSLDTYNGCTVLDWQYQENAISELDTFLHNYVDTAGLVSGEAILSTEFNNMVTLFHELRKENVPLAFQWHGEQSSGAYATPAASNKQAFVTTSTSYVNIFDQTVTSRSATSPGITIPADYMGVGLATTANITLRAYGHGTSGSTPAGYIKFIGPNGSAEIEVGGVGAVCGSDSDTLALNADIHPAASGADALGTSTDQNKIDIHFKSNGAGTVCLHQLVGWFLPW